MSITEAKEYVDLVIEELVARGYITDNAYGKMPATLSEDIAAKVRDRSEE